MSKNKPSIIKRGSILLMIFFTVFFSIITNAKIDNTDLDSVKRELGDILLQKIKEKAAE